MHDSTFYFCYYLFIFAITFFFLLLLCLTHLQFFLDTLVLFFFYLFHFQFFHALTMRTSSKGEGRMEWWDVTSGSCDHLDRFHRHVNVPHCYLTAFPGACDLLRTLSPFPPPKDQDWTGPRLKWTGK